MPHKNAISRLKAFMKLYLYRSILTSRLLVENLHKFTLAQISACPMNKQHFTIYSPASSKFALLPQNNVCFYKVSNITRSMVSPLLPTPPLLSSAECLLMLEYFCFWELNLDKKRQLWNEATFKWSEIIHFKAWNHTNLCLEHMPGRDQWWGWSLLNGGRQKVERQTDRRTEAVANLTVYRVRVCRRNL